ncbi:MAG TPA: VWA domain-containing protein [Bryobacteraceae bacterium]|nr:VWA domain-containing protein [Bryobacteraceae bacterium]
MKRRLAISFLTTAGAVLFFVLLLPAARTDDQPDFVIRSDVRLVLLDVSVKDRDGGMVMGLNKDNFHVDENGAPQDITVFASKDVPVTVGILVDESFSMTPKRAEVLQAAGAFVEASNPRDEIFVLNFNDTVRRGLPKDVLFSDDLQQLRDALSRGVPQGRTALNDAVMDGLQQLEEGRRDKKTLIVISDGGDNASQHKRREMLDRVERSLATVYTVGLFTPGDPEQDPGILKKLAKMTGGQAYFPTDPEDMTEVCTGIAKDIRTRYTIGYLPPESNGGAERRIHVRVAVPGRPGLSARTRVSYHYEQTPVQSSQ